MGLIFTVRQSSTKIGPLEKFPAIQYIPIQEEIFLITHIWGTLQVFLNRRWGGGRILLINWNSQLILLCKVWFDVLFSAMLYLSLSLQPLPLH